MLLGQFLLKNAINYHINKPKKPLCSQTERLESSTTYLIVVIHHQQQLQLHQKL